MEDGDGGITNEDREYQNAADAMDDSDALADEPICFDQTNRNVGSI